MITTTPNPFHVAADIICPQQPDIVDPVTWVNSTLSDHLWSKQIEILQSVHNHRRTAVHSCHKMGKSFVAARAAAWWIESHPIGEAFVVTSARTGSQVRAILWREIGRVHRKGNLQGRLNQTEWWAMTPAGNEEMVAIGRKPADMDPAAFQGMHARYVLVIFDEACWIPTPLWDAADTLIGNDDSRFLAIGNPDDPATEFADACKPGSGWNVIGVSAFDTPNFTNEIVPANLRGVLIGETWIKEKRKKWGEDGPLYISKVKGQFPESSEGGLIPLRLVRAAQDRTLEPGKPNELGLDVGGGGDKSVTAHRRGPVVRVIRRQNNPDTMQTLGMMLQDLKSTGATLSRVDVIGIGKGVVDRAREQRKPVLGINVGRRAIDRERFVNIRAEGFWNLRELFESGNIDIDPNDEDLASQLIDIRYKVTSGGKIQIESKDDMKRRGRESPNEADAVMLAMLEKYKRSVKLTW